jgi:hypothetical protein
MERCLCLCVQVLCDSAVARFEVNVSKKSSAAVCADFV